MGEVRARVPQVGAGHPAQVSRTGRVDPGIWSDQDKDILVSYRSAYYGRAGFGPV